MGFPPHSALSVRGGKNLISSHQNSSMRHALHKAYTNHWDTLEGRNQKEQRIQPQSLGKGGLKHSKFEKKKMKR